MLNIFLRVFKELSVKKIRMAHKMFYNEFSAQNEYQETIAALNGLQSNAAVLEKIRNSQLPNNDEKLKETNSYLSRTGISSSDLDKLSVIHIAGTKGKGSTCAFVESILREHGFKTGFFSSPHLVSVTERIRINGVPIPEKEFSFYFWKVYNSLLKAKEHEEDMPAYFKFLTVMALNVFLQEEVDVAIIEVGLGGAYDCTNIIRNPVVCGISTLDFDHTSILGSSIEEIAWHKAGIMKKNAPTFSVSQEHSEALKVLYARAQEKEVELYVVPPLENYDWGGRPIKLGLSGYVQFLNSSLALQLAHYWLHREEYRSKASSLAINEPFSLTEEDISALANVVWLGRSQVLATDFATFFIDGAHTLLSIQNCIQWYEKESQLNINSSHEKVCRVLVFNMSGQRDGEPMLQLLRDCNFDHVIFTTNLVSCGMPASSDQRVYSVSEAEQNENCKNLYRTWLNLTSSYSESIKSGSIETPNALRDSSSSERQTTYDSQNCVVFPCINDVLEWLKKEKSQDHSNDGQVNVLPSIFKDASHIQVLVTGSLHLVGGFLSALDPSLSMENNVIENTSIASIIKSKYTASPGIP